MNKVSLTKFYILFSLLAVSANLAHPITPKLLSDLAMPDYMFGMAFAAMSFSNFLFCPFWGVISDNIGRSKTICITLLGYALGQFMFMNATTITTLLIARLFAGVFAGGYMVASMAYVADMTDVNNRAKYMSFYVAYLSVSSAIGFLIGGVLGDYSIKATFIVQVVSLSLVGLLFLAFLKESNKNANKKIDYKLLLHSANPFSSFVQASSILKMALSTFLIVVFLTSFATNAYDNAFNYYIRQEFAFPPSYNGMIKAAMGLIGLVANFTINQYLAKKTNCRKSIVGVLALCGISLYLVTFIKTAPFFIAANIIFYCFNTMYLPIQQTLMTEDQNGSSNGIVSGLFNSVKSIGMIIGALFAGYIYTVNNILPFIFAALAFIVGAIISIINYFQYHKKPQEETR